MLKPLMIDTPSMNPSWLLERRGKPGRSDVPPGSKPQCACLLLTLQMLLLLPGSVFAASPSAPIPTDHAERMTRGLENFQRDVRALLIEQCLNCHGGEKTKGGFSLATREDLLKGGDEGPVVTPFQARTSRLMKLIEHAEEPHMPEKKPQLPPAAVARISAWIEDGAPYDRPLVDGRSRGPDRSVVTREDRQWWSFRPLGRVEPPPPHSPRGAVPYSHPVDRFIVAKAATKGLGLTPPADRRTLIRRAYLDLLGLPPAPEAIETFLADTAADAWPRLIANLLASPQYGERWARHWLDLARFAESSGFEHDYDREGAFHYRDFVIKALNLDLPYDQFVRWQLAGDESEPDNPLALAATGFLGAGVFPTQITANEVERTRYDALDDMLSTTGSAFLGLSIGCARCHDHKYDPIPTQDYYRLLSTFTTTTRSVIDLDVDPEKTREQTRRWEAEHAPLRTDAASYEESLRPRFDAWLQDGAPLPKPLGWTALDLTNLVSKAGAKFRKLADASYLAEGNNGDQDDYSVVVTSPLARVTGLRLDALADPSLKKNGPGRADNGNIGLSRIRVSLVTATATQDVRIAKAAADFEQNPEHLSAAAALDDDPKTGWAIDPQFGKDHSVVFTFAEPLELGDGNRLKVQLEFHLNTRHTIGRPRLSLTAEPVPSLDGEVVPEGIARALRQVRSPGLAARLEDGGRARLFDWWKGRDSGWNERQDRLQAHARKKPDGRTKVLVCAEGYPPLRMHTQGADFFKETYILKRGNTELKNGVAEQGFLQVLMPAGASTAAVVSTSWAWTPPSGVKGSGRRRSLANWLTDTETGAGALLARVAVNRLWQHHFGQGLVATPSDFGRAGAPPTHPELLDWLAGELIRQGWKLKSIHQLLMTSATYQQSAAPDRAREQADPANELFVRRVPKRLEGEIIRDSMLAVSGQLDRRMFGKGTRDERSRRRSIYFTIKRSELMGSMVAFDQPEPLVSQGARPVTTVAPQALFLLNGPAVREWAEGFARRIREDNPAASPGDRVARAMGLALGRPPTAEENREAMTFLSAQEASYRAEGKAEPEELALTDYCQVLFGLNEFAYEN